MRVKTSIPVTGGRGESGDWNPRTVLALHAEQKPKGRRCRISGVGVEVKGVQRPVYILGVPEPLFSMLSTGEKRELVSGLRTPWASFKV